MTSAGGVSLNISETTLLEESVTFEGIQALAFLVFLALAVVILIKKGDSSKHLPIWTIICDLLLYLLKAILETVSDSQSIVRSTGGGEVPRPGTAAATRYYVQLSFAYFFQFLSIPLNFYIFYSLIHLVLTRLSNVKKPFKKVRIFHWVCLGIISGLALVSGSLISAMFAKYDKGEYLVYDIENAQIYLSGAFFIVAWVAAWENMGWTIFLAIKTVRNRGKWMLPALFLLLGAVFWCAQLFLEALYTIVYQLSPAQRSISSGILNLGSVIFKIIEVICTIISWIGILLFCFRFVPPQSEGDEQSPAQDVGYWTQNSHLSPPPLSQHDHHYFSSKDYRPFSQYHSGHFTAEADSTAFTPEMEAGKPIFEADSGAKQKPGSRKLPYA